MKRHAAARLRFKNEQLRHRVATANKSHAQTCKQLDDLRVAFSSLSSLVNFERESSKILRDENYALKLKLAIRDTDIKPQLKLARLTGKRRIRNL